MVEKKKEFSVYSLPNLIARVSFFFIIKFVHKVGWCFFAFVNEFLQSDIFNELSGSLFRACTREKGLKSVEDRESSRNEVPSLFFTQICIFFAVG